MRDNSFEKGRVVIQGLVFDWDCDDDELRVRNGRYGRRRASLAYGSPVLLAQLVALSMIRDGPGCELKDTGTD